MSIHKSLFIGGDLAQSRSVWTRRERLEALMKEGRWQEEQSVFGIPKVRTKFKVMTRKKKKSAEGEAGEAGAVAAAGSEPKKEAGAS